MGKYRNRRVKWRGEIYDSEKELRRWRELELLQRAGKISNLARQVKFELIPAQKESYPRYGKTGKRLKDGSRTVELACDYVADFVYSVDGKTVVEDVKGYKDPASAAYAKFVIKRKLMLARYGIKIKEV